jgi:hypothetical protein
MYYFKKMLLALILIMSSFCYSQDPELFENTWYLHHFEYNGEVYQHAPNNEVTSITLDFQEPNSFLSIVCNLLSGYSLSWNNNSFIFTELNQTLGSCQNGYNGNLEALYFQFYFMTSTGGFENQPYTYQIFNNPNDTKTLIITNILGEEAVYGNYQLSVSSYEKQIVSFYPNPTRNILHIKQGASQNDLEISIIDVNGKIVLNTSNTSLNQIDISSLDKGLYFAKVKTSNGKTQIEKIIKQ